MLIVIRLILVLVFILKAAIVIKGSDSVYYVCPDGDSSSCSVDQNKRNECNTLNFYSRGNYFSSSTTFYFLDGVFKHSTRLVVENKNSLSLIQHSSSKKSTIDCSECDDAGFVFVNVTNLKIEGISFKKCGQSFDVPENINHKNTSIRSALLCLYGHHHNLTNVRISNSLDQNIYYSQVEGNISIYNSTFANAVDKQLNNSYIAGNAFIFGDCNKKTALLIENTKFANNSNRHGKSNTAAPQTDPDYFSSGLLIILECTDVNVTLLNVTLHNNTGYFGGNLAIVFYNISHIFTSPVQIQNCLISNGKGSVGGGIYIELVEASLQWNKNCTPTPCARKVLEINNTNVTDNKAVYSGGGMYLRLKESQTYCSLAKISINKCNFISNKLNKKGLGGVAFEAVNYVAFQYLQHAQPQFHIEITNSNFSDHIVSKPSGKGVIFAKTSPNVHLINVSIHDNSCSGILGMRSNFIVSENVDIYNNNGSSGGGILFCSDSILFLTPNSMLTIKNNNAHHAGGGICIDIQCLQSLPMCFFQLDESAAENPGLIDTIHVNLIDNTAVYAGDDLYGGSVDYCYLLDSPYHNISANNSLSVFKQIFINHSSDNPSSITSPPRRVCLCNISIEDRCRTSSINISVFPGETFALPLVIIGQLNGTVPGTIEASLKEDDMFLKGRFETLSNKTCKNISYTVFSDRPNVILELKVQIIGDASFVDHLSDFSPLLLNVSLKQCPIGFQLAQHEDRGYTCKCDSAFKNQHNIKCDIKNQSLIFHKPIWVGYKTETQTFLVSEGIPFDYFIPNDTVVVKASHYSLYQDSQCSHKRTGVLCGACPSNYSVIFGSSECRSNCTNSYLSLLLVFVLAGIVLVCFLTCLNLTVAEGTVSGLIFYANVIQVHRPVLFQYNHVSILTPSLLIFVSWINLDLGIPVCFYQGMDEYAKAWLQFFFPVYIWMISGVIIYLSRRFAAFNKLFGNNGVKILATLILLSYSKMLRAMILTGHFQTIYHYKGRDINTTITHVFHWKPDANLLFFHGKHIPLFMIGAMFMIICLPFTFTLLCIQNLQKISHRQCFTWVWRLKPFFDTYTGPYSKRAKFWPGLLLLMRVFLYTMSAVNYNYGVQVTNVFATIVVCIILFVTAWKLQPSVYERKALDSLECSFLLNLSFLCTGTAYTIYDERHAAQTVLAHISVLVAFLTFLGILIYHMYIKCKQIWKNKCQQTEHENPNVTITTSEVNITEHQGLNNYPPFIRFDQDREPLLATESEENTRIN